MDRDNYAPSAFDSVRRLEEVIADYAGSKYAAAVDSCTNALFLSCMYLDVKDKEVTIPSRTYVSVPCSIIHAGGKVRFEDWDWKGIYPLSPFPIIDGAKRFQKGMYISSTFHCLSFHVKKHLKIGRGGMILTDDKKAYEWFKLARFDGREEVALNKQKDFKVLGWNYYMTPEQASRGLWLMSMMPDYNEDQGEDPPYPDLSKYEIYSQR